MYVCTLNETIWEIYHGLQNRYKSRSALFIGIQTIQGPPKFIIVAYEFPVNAFLQHSSNNASQNTGEAIH